MISACSLSVLNSLLISVITPTNISMGCLGLNLVPQWPLFVYVAGIHFSPLDPMDMSVRPFAEVCLDRHSWAHLHQGRITP